MARELVLEVGYEGGGFELFAELEGGVPSRFYFASGGPSPFGEELDEPRADHGPLRWGDVLATQLEPNGWLELTPMFVHPALLPRVRTAIGAATREVRGSWLETIDRLARTSGAAPQTYVLVGADGAKHESATPGKLGGNAKDKIYGTLGCGTARAAIRRGGDTYARARVFFADEATAIAAGYRPCGNCMRAQHAAWKQRQADRAR